MVEKTPQLNVFKIPLDLYIDQNHELCLLSKKIDWDQVEKDFSEYYCTNNGRPSIPIRKIVGVILFLFSTLFKSTKNKLQTSSLLS